MSLTELTIKNLKPTDRVYRIADSNGLCLEASPSGSSREASVKQSLDCELV